MHEPFHKTITKLENIRSNFMHFQMLPFEHMMSDI